MGSAMLEDRCLATGSEFLWRHVYYQDVCAKDADSEHGLSYGFNDKDGLEGQLGEML